MVEAALDGLGPAVTEAVAALRARGPAPGLLEELEKLASAPLAEGFHRTGLVAGVARELVDPTLIRQRSHKTCAAAVVQLWLALREPAEYVRLARALASPSGAAAFATGQALRRAAGTELDDRSGRSESCRIVQAAFMEFGNESDRYCNARDRSFRRRGPRYAGLFPDQFDGLLEAATGKEWETLEVSPVNSAEAVAAVISAASTGTLVPVTVGSGRRKHKILVDGLDGGLVKAIDPVGKRVLFRQEDFRGQLRCVSLPAPAPVEMCELAPRHAGVPWVRLRTLSPAFPDTCPGCGRHAAHPVPLEHEAGTLHVSLCGDCRRVPVAGCLKIAAVLLLVFFEALATASLNPEIVAVVSLVVAAGFVAVLVAHHRQGPAVEILSSRVDPPRIEVAARNRRWLSHLSRLNPGSSRSYLERW